MSRLKKVYGYTRSALCFCVVLAALEQLGLPQEFIGYTFLFATIFLYAGIGFLSKTNEPDNYYVAGRRVPALFNGMATGADWMSLPHSLEWLAVYMSEVIKLLLLSWGGQVDMFSSRSF